MGQEAACTVRYGKQRSEGKALLETNELIFRGEFRLRIALSSIESIKAVQGELRVQTAEDLAVFQLGEKAEKWCQKILHPKTRLEKLGVKAGTSVSLVGKFDAEFLRELRGFTKNTHNGRAGAGSECIFLGADAPKDLAGVGKAVKVMRGAAALWVVYPKAKREITENDVLAAGRKAGLKDVKVVSFSTTHTGLKFVIPLNQR